MIMKKGFPNTLKLLHNHMDIRNSLTTLDKCCPNHNYQLTLLCHTVDKFDKYNFKFSFVLAKASSENQR